MMKFDFCIGNPPYMDGHLQIYPVFFESGKQIATTVEMIFPVGWQKPKVANGLAKLNTEDVKKDRQIIFINNKENVFPGVDGAKYTNIILWKRGYNNGLHGKQKIIENDGTVKEVELLVDRSQIIKPKEIVSIVDKVNKLGEPKILHMVSARKPYGLETDSLDNPGKYGITLSDTTDTDKDTVRLFGKIRGQGRIFKYISRSALPKESPLLDHYKLFVAQAWGNMDESTGFLGGSYSPVLVAVPKDCCSATYVEVGPFDNKEQAENARKYFCTRFFRAIFYKDKFARSTARDVYASVPVQNFSNKSNIDWSGSVTSIEEQLYKKYGLSQDEIDFIETHIKEME